MKKRFLFLLLTMLAIGFLCFALLPSDAQAAELIDSGTCGENLTWALDSNGVLTISGQGDMDHFHSWDFPWIKYVQDIKTICISDGVTQIGENAFRGCSSATEVTIADSVEVICHYAFYNCKSLTAVELSSSLTFIDEYAFYNCASLTAVTIPDSVITIGQYAFANCEGLETVTLGANLQTISSYAFASCHSLMQLRIPDSVTNLGIHAFDKCYALTSVTIGNGVSNIQRGTFLDCQALTDLVIGDGVTEISRDAFIDCVSLRSVQLGASVEAINAEAFQGCTQLECFTVDENNPHFQAVDGVLYSRDGKTLIRYPMGRNGPFTVPEGVTEIAIYAFHDCLNLGQLTIPQGVERIADYAFSGSIWLKQIHFLGDAPVLEGYVMGRAPADVYYPWGNDTWDTVIEAYEDWVINWIAAEPDCNHIWGDAQVTEPTCTAPGAITYVCSVCTFEKEEFTGEANGHTFTSISTMPGCEQGGASIHTCTQCGYVVETTISPTGHRYQNDVCTVCGSAAPEGLVAQGGCGDNLIWQILDDGTLTISGQGDMNHFQIDYNYDSVPWRDYRDQITSVIISDGVTSVGTSAFEGCGSLTFVTISNSVRTIGPRAFHYCDALIHVTLGNGLTEIGDYAFIACKNLTGVILPDSVTSVGRQAFKECDSLIYLSIPGTLSFSWDTFGSPPDLWHVCFRGSNSTSAGFGTAVLHKQCTDEELVITQTEGTCTTPAAIVISCTICQESKTVTLSEFQHNWKNATCTQPMTCYDCGITSGTSLGLDHQWAESSVAQQPGEKPVDAKLYVCAVCGETKLEVNRSTNEKVEQTDSGWMLPTGIGSAAVIIGGGLLLWKRKRKQYR